MITDWILYKIYTKNIRITAKKQVEGINKFDTYKKNRNSEEIIKSKDN